MTAGKTRGRIQRMVKVLLIRDEPCLGLPEAARRKGVSRQAVWQACRAGRLRAHSVPGGRYGRTWFVPVADLRRWRPDGAG